MTHETDPRSENSASIGAITTGLTAVQIDRWANMIADGRCDLPDDLAAGDRDRMVIAVRQRLRDRLLQLIARAIAAEIRRDLESG